MSKKQKSRKSVNINAVLPRYRLVIPCILCAYMILAGFVTGMDNKSVLLCSAAVCTVLWFIGERIFPDKVYAEEIKHHNKYIYICIGIFATTAILSELLAGDYPYSGLRGEDDSVLVLISYIVIFYMAYRYFYMEECRKLLSYAVIAVAVITVLMSVLEFMDVPIAAWWAGSVEVLEERNRVVLTFGNSNYYGAFCCMLLPFIMELWLHEENKLKKGLLTVLNGCLISCVLMAKSTTAVYIMVLVAVAILVYEFKNVIRQMLWLIAFLGVTALMILAFNIASSGKMLELIRIGVDNSDAFEQESEQNIYEISDIRLEGNRVVIDGISGSFIIEYDNQFTFYDEDNNILDIENSDNTITFTDEQYNMITVNVSYNSRVELLYLEIDAGYKETIDFYIAEDGFKGVGADGNAVDDISGSSDKDGDNANKLYSMFTGRGYIWANTVPMLGDVLFIGKGCGNFVYNFKQYDYVGLLKSQGTHNVIIDRPHNMFLQYSMDIGVLGAVAVFVLIAYVLICWLRQRAKQGKDENVLSVASFMAVLAFMIFTLLNDSLVILSPYMWIMLGAVMSFLNSKENSAKK